MGTQLPPSLEDMGDPLPAAARARRAARQIDDATRRRDEAMRHMRAEGATLRQIAETVGLTHTGVRKILRKDLPAEEEGEG